MSAVRPILTHALAVYLGAGLFAGVMLQRGIPALNPIGIAFVAVTWPNQVRCARVSSGCNPLPPEWMEPYLFTFPAGRAALSREEGR